MRIFFFGDIVGKVGRQAVHLSLPILKEKYKVDFFIGNGENASHGRGLAKGQYEELVTYGLNAITLGNHWADKPAIENYMDRAEALVRPLNLINFSKGSGSKVFSLNGTQIRITNILGSNMMKEEVESPFKSFASLIKNTPKTIHIVDYHAESTSEKILFARYFDGQASAFLGTHTHVQTADEKILTKGSAFISDVGMTGDGEGIIGFETNSAIEKVVLGKRTPFKINERAPKMINGVLLDINEETYLANSIVRIKEVYYEKNVNS